MFNWFNLENIIELFKSDTQYAVVLIANIICIFIGLFLGLHIFFVMLNVLATGGLIWVGSKPKE